MVDDKVLEEIRFHQDVVEHDNNSPLYRIRETELEIAGRIMAAKQEADSIVAEARKRAAEIVANAQVDGDKMGKEAGDRAIAAAERQAAELREKAQAEAAALEESLASRRARAARSVVEAVTTV